MKKPSDTSDNGPDVSDLFLASLGNVIGGAPDPGPATGSPIVVPEEAEEAEAAIAQSGPGGPGSAVAVGSSAGLTINLLFDAAAMSAPQSFRDGVTQAMAMICAAVTDKITINLQIDWSGTGGGAAGGPSGGFFEPYSTVRADLVNNASPGDATFNSLPTGSSIAGQTQVAAWYSQLKLWGLVSPTGTEVDGSATFATDINPNLLVGVALHELTHAMGRVPYGPPFGSQPDIFDFYRFTSPGNILIDGAATAPPAYFSLNGGVTKLADYGQTSDASDYLNSGVQGFTDPFNEFYSGSTQQHLTPIDLQELDALGFHLAINNQTTTVIEAKGSTALTQVGNNFFLDPVAGGTGPELMYQGAPVTAGEFGSYVLIGAEAVSNGYEVAWKNAATGQYSVWSTDSSGNYTGNFYMPGPGNSTALEALEPSFQQDLNGDGVIGVPPQTGTTTVIEAIGTTALVQVGNDFFLNPVAGGTGPELMYQGAPVTAGEFGTYVLIGADAVSGGYEVAWKDPATGQYSVWSTDGNGNYTGNFYMPGPGNHPVLEALETSFQQDLNTDGHIGVPPNTTVIESVGATELVQVGSDYFLTPVVGGAMTELMYQGSPVTAGMFGSYVPTGVEAVSGGYELAWKNPATSQYSVWSTDANGNYTGNFYLPGAGNSVVLESLEPSFHQDLNGDGHVGLPAGTSLIEGIGSTALVQVENNFFLDPVSGGTGPELMYQGSPVTAGMFGTYVPIGVEAVSGGYELAWRSPDTNQYSVWSTDSSGNYNGNFYTPGPGNSTTLEALEPSFHQDLNGDGAIGIPAQTSPAAQTASTAPATSAGGGDTFVFRPGLGGTSNPPPPATSQDAGMLIKFATTNSTVAHIDIGDAHDLSGTHEGAVQGLVFDPFHGFIIH